MNNQIDISNNINKSLIVKKIHAPVNNKEVNIKEFLESAGVCSSVIRNIPEESASHYFTPELFSGWPFDAFDDGDIPQTSSSSNQARSRNDCQEFEFNIYTGISVKGTICSNDKITFTVILLGIEFTIIEPTIRGNGACNKFSALGMNVNLCFTIENNCLFCSGSYHALFVNDKWKEKILCL